MFQFAPFASLQLVLEGMDERHVDAHFHNRGHVAVLVEQGHGLHEPVVPRPVGVDAAFLIALDGPFLPCALDRAFGAGSGPAFVDLVAGVARLRIVPDGEAVVPAQEAVFAVLHGNAAGDHVEQSLEVVLPAAHFFEVVLIADAEFNDGPRELAEFVVAAGVVEGDGLPFAHGLHTGDHAADGQTHFIPIKGHRDGAKEQGNGGQDNPEPFVGHQPQNGPHPGEKQQRRHGDGLDHEAVGSESAMHRQPRFPAVRREPPERKRLFPVHGLAGGVLGLKHPVDDGEQLFGIEGLLEGGHGVADGEVDALEAADHDDGRVLECGVHGHLAVKARPPFVGHFHVQRNEIGPFRFEDGKGFLDAGCGTGRVAVVGENFGDVLDDIRVVVDGQDLLGHGASPCVRIRRWLVRERAG